MRKAEKSFCPPQTPKYCGTLESEQFSSDFFINLIHLKCLNSFSMALLPSHSTFPLQTSSNASVHRQVLINLNKVAQGCLGSPMKRAVMQILILKTEANTVLLVLATCLISVAPALLTNTGEKFLAFFLFWILLLLWLWLFYIGNRQQE